MPSGTRCWPHFSRSGRGNGRASYWGRVASKDAVTVRLRIGNSPVYQVPVGEGGWFAYTWKSTASHPQKTFPKVAAYDKAGKIVKVFE